MKNQIFGLESEFTHSIPTLKINTQTITTSLGKVKVVPRYNMLPPFIPPKIHFEINHISPPDFQDLSDITSSSISLSEKYFPESYSELISEESSNRKVLQWMRNLKPNSKDNVLILSGPPGSGKSTLIKIVAKLCNFNPIEISSCDDLHSDRSELLYLGNVGFKSVFQSKLTPILVLDESSFENSSIFKLIVSQHERPVIITVTDLYFPI